MSARQTASGAVAYIAPAQLQRVVAARRIAVLEACWPDQRLRRLSCGELEQLISAECNNPYTKPMILLALETAMRLGELLSLKWSRVDLDRGFAELQKTKNGHGRMVPLTAAALSVLSNLERDGDVVFPVKPGTLKQSWVRLVKRAGISDLRFHDLRHEAISRLLGEGADDT